MVDNRERPGSEFNTYNPESFGQLAKISTSLSPEVFPHGFNLPAQSRFYNSLSEGVYQGKGVTVRGNLKGGRMRPGGVLVEHTAILGANNLGELMASKEIFEGNLVCSLTDSSKEDFNRHLNWLMKTPLPLGWRTFGLIHSHPILDVLNNLGLIPINLPKVGQIPLSWSGEDFRVLLDTAKGGSRGLTTEVLVTPIQISFMIATKTTLEALEKPNKELQKAMDSTSWLPPYRIFEKYGVVLYGGNCLGRKKGDIKMERLI